MLRLCSLLVLLASPAVCETLTGRIRVIDADTIDIGASAPVRLIAIDAAEMDQTCRVTDGTVVACGRMATDAARTLYEGRTASCRVEGHDRHGRALAVCRVDGQDMNAELVARGLARVYRQGMRYADLRYAAEQKEAVLLGRGLWVYDMIDPALHRASGRPVTAAPAAPVAGCAIKGNLSGSGRIYHMPGQRDYDATRISPGRGERWFCTEAEARAAGWRPARR